MPGTAWYSSVLNTLPIPLLIHIVNCLTLPLFPFAEAWALPLPGERTDWLFCLQCCCCSNKRFSLPYRRKRRPQTKRLIESKLSRKVLSTIDWMCTEQREHHIWGFDAFSFVFIFSIHCRFSLFFLVQLAALFNNQVNRSKQLIEHPA